MACNVLLLIIGSIIGGLSWRDVTIDNGDVRLAAELHVPEGHGPFPAVVLIHGSEPGIRKNYREYAKFFAANGIVALTYDKRGCGESGGNYLLADFHDLSGDALAAVAYLRSQSFVDTSRVGLWGISQGGWITLLATDRSPAVKFIINVSSPVVSPEKQVPFALAGDLSADGFDLQTQNWILDLYRRFWLYVRDRRGWEELFRLVQMRKQHSEIRRADELGYFVHFNSLFREPAALPPLNRLHVHPWVRNFDFDPLPLVQRLKVPILWIFGQRDRLVNVDESVGLLRTVANGHDSGSRIIVYPAANHSLRIPRWPHILFSPVFPKGYLESMAKFITNTGSQR